MKVNAPQPFPSFGKNNKYYQYGNQRFANPNYKPANKKDIIKTSLLLSFGFLALGVGILTKPKIF